MLLRLKTKDIKLTPLMQTAYTNFYNNTYKSRYNEVRVKTWKEEDVRGHSKYMIHQSYFMMAFQFGALIYDQVRRGVNTTYAYYAAKYDFDAIREKFACYDIHLNHVFDAFGLFSDTIIAPADVIDGIYYINPGEGSGTLISYDMTGLNLITGWNLINHNKNGEVVGLTLLDQYGNSQTAGWSKTHTLVSNIRAQVAVYSTVARNNVTLELIIDLTE